MLKKKYDYGNKEKLVKEYSDYYTDDYEFTEFVIERLEYFSDRFGDEHIEFFDLLWKELKKRLKKRNLKRGISYKE